VAEPIEAVVFDWGGTLTPWHTVDFEQEAHALAQAVVMASVSHGKPVPVTPGETAAQALRRAGDVVWGRSRRTTRRC